MTNDTRYNRLLARIELALLVLSFTILTGGCLPDRAADTSPHLLMGNPSNATAGFFEENNLLVCHRHFVLSYNGREGRPNWVSWRLTKEGLGVAERGQFHPDSQLPDYLQVMPSDYADSGFDRGHMCPHGDRTADPNMSQSTFVMSNIVPQSPDLNQRTWERLESYCRDLARDDKVLYIISGPSGKGGSGKNGKRSIIGRKNTVVVPSKCWKVIMVLDGASHDDIARVNSKTRLIAVIMPNTMSVSKKDWFKYRVSVEEVERLTGYEFFSNVPSEVIKPLKKKVDRTPIKESN